MLCAQELSRFPISFSHGLPRRAQIDRYVNENAGAATRRSSNIELCTQIFCPGPHAGKSETIPVGQLRIGDTGPVVDNLKNKVWSVPSHVNDDERGPCIVNSVSNCLLRNYYEILPELDEYGFFK